MRTHVPFADAPVTTPTSRELIEAMHHDAYCHPRGKLAFAASKHSVIEFRIPVLAASLGRGVEDRPERIDVGSAAWILSGIGHRAAHLGGPEMADRAVAAGGTPLHRPPRHPRPP